MKRFGASLIALALVLAVGAGPARAQAGTGAISLVDAVLLARDNSLAAQASRRLLEQSQAQRGITVGQALPNLALQTSANYNQLPGSFGGALGGFGGLTGFPQQGVTVDTTLQASQVIFDAFATTDALAIAEYQIRQARFGVLQAEQDAMLNAAVAYFQVLRTEGLAEVSANAVKQSQEQLRLADLRLRAGTGTRAETLQLRARLANAQGTLTQTRNAVAVARLTLANALNAPVTDRALVASPMVPPMRVDLTQQQIIEALGRRPEVQRLVLAEEANERQVLLESRALWPNLQATSRYSQRGLAQGQFVAGVTMNWALFDGFRVRNRMELARAQAEAVQVQVEQARQNTALDIRQQYQTREEAAQRVGVAREGLAAAQEAYRLALRRFEVGLSTPFEVTDVQATLVQSHNNYVQAVNDLRVAEIRLARALGYDLAAYLAPGTAATR